MWTTADYGVVVGDLGDSLEVAGIEYATKGFVFIYANRERERRHQHSSYTVHNDHHAVWNVIGGNSSASHALLEQYYNLDGSFDTEAYPFGQQFAAATGRRLAARRATLLGRVGKGEEL